MKPKHHRTSEKTSDLVEDCFDEPDDEMEIDELYPKAEVFIGKMKGSE